MRLERFSFLSQNDICMRLWGPIPKCALCGVAESQQRVQKTLRRRPIEPLQLRSERTRHIYAQLLRTTAYCRYYYYYYYYQLPIVQKPLHCVCAGSELIIVLVS